MRTNKKGRRKTIKASLEAVHPVRIIGAPAIAAAVKAVTQTGGVIPPMDP